jgi:hypothetical protein
MGVSVALRPGAQRRERRSVAEFLSDEWIRALGDAARAGTGETAAAEAALVVEPVVLGVPGRGEVRYRVICDETVRAVSPASADDSVVDVRIETDYPTAVAIARGEVNAQAALADGRLRVAGDVARLAGFAGALAKLGDLFAAVRASTTFVDAADRTFERRS